MAQISRDDPWHYNSAEDIYVHMVTGERLTPPQWQARQNVGDEKPPFAWTPPSPPLPPRMTTSVAMVSLSDVLAALEEIERKYYVSDEGNVMRFAAHVAERVRGLANVRDPKELLR